MTPAQRFKSIADGYTGIDTPPQTLLKMGKAIAGQYNLVEAYEAAGTANEKARVILPRMIQEMRERWRKSEHHARKVTVENEVNAEIDSTIPEFNQEAL